MKYLLVFLLLSFSSAAFAQTEPDNKDSLILHKYIGGKPSMKYLEAEKQTAAKWGFTIDYFFGDCGGTFDYKLEEFKILNEKSAAGFTARFGENWVERFYTDVDSLLKEK